MSNFIKKLIKYFHPDNLKTGDNDKFITLMEQIDNKDIRFSYNLSLKEVIYGKTIVIGDEEFKINSFDPITKKSGYNYYTSNDGTKFCIKLDFDKKDEEQNLELKQINGVWSLVKNIEINGFDAIFGNREVTFKIYDNEYTYEVEPFSMIKNNDYRLLNDKLNNMRIYIKFSINYSSNDKNFIEKMKEICYGNGCF